MSTGAASRQSFPGLRVLRINGRSRNVQIVHLSGHRKRIEKHDAGYLQPIFQPGLHLVLRLLVDTRVGQFPIVLGQLRRVGLHFRRRCVWGCGGGRHCAGRRGRRCRRSRDGGHVTSGRSNQLLDHAMELTHFRTRFREFRASLLQRLAQYLEARVQVPRIRGRGRATCRSGCRAGRSAGRDVGLAARLSMARPGTAERQVEDCPQRCRWYAAPVPTESSHHTLSLGTEGALRPPWILGTVEDLFQPGACLARRSLEHPKSLPLTPDGAHFSANFAPQRGFDNLVTFPRLCRYIYAIFWPPGWALGLAWQ